MPSQKVKPSQDFVPIEQVRDGILVLKDGTMRAIVMASSVNMVLKSEDEQAAILHQFENFLNSLDFSIQIFVQSRSLDIKPYLSLLEEQIKTQQSELMKIQIREYIDFVRGFVGGANIMTKGFYVVVPYSPPSLEVTPTAEGIQAIFNSQKSNPQHISMQLFEEYRSQIEQRLSVVVQGLSRAGIRSVQLGTEEVIELFYRLFNIGETEGPIATNSIN
jgi:hypothetical protein